MTVRRVPVALAALLAAPVAIGCPCGASLGPVAPWTRAADEFALAAGLAFQTELGTVDARGRSW